VLPAGLAIESLKWAARQPRSYDLQRRAQIDADGRQKRAADGKPAYTKILEWRDRETSDRWSAAVIDLVRRAHPDALDGGRG
jgi:hypothetical protein